MDQNLKIILTQISTANELWLIWLGGGKGYFRHSSKLFYIKGIAVGQPPISYHFWVCWWTSFPEKLRPLRLEVAEIRMLRLLKTISISIDDVNCGHKFYETSFWLVWHYALIWFNLAKMKIISSLHFQTVHFTKIEKWKFDIRLNENNSAVSGKLDQQTYRNTESLFSKQI